MRQPIHCTQIDCDFAILFMTSANSRNPFIADCRYPTWQPGQESDMIFLILKCQREKNFRSSEKIAIIK